MEDTETHSIELSKAEAREVITALSEFKERASARSESDEETVTNVQNRFEETFGFKDERDTANDTDNETLPGGH
jgi:protoporphyrinogen oxidase